MPLGSHIFSACFRTTDLLVNITKHVLKPKHQVLTDRAKHKLLKKYNVAEKQARGIYCCSLHFTELQIFLYNQVF